MVEMIGDDKTNTNKYQHLLLVLEQEQPRNKIACHVKYANLIMNWFSIRASDRFEVCRVQTVQVPNLYNSRYTEWENDEKERKRAAGQQVRVRNIIFLLIYRL